MCENSQRSYWCWWGGTELAVRSWSVKAMWAVQISWPAPSSVGLCSLQRKPQPYTKENTSLLLQACPCVPIMKCESDTIHICMPWSHAGTHSRPDCFLSSFHLFSRIRCKFTSPSQMSSSIAGLYDFTSAVNITIALKCFNTTSEEKER